ncbi:MAG TPA: threonine ammonia-lyase [Burkholderiales bacterium]|nr:threonine ammonia-lyase [Burkholderiales bacterium]
MSVTLEDIQAAAKVIEGHVLNTPCVHSRTLSELVGAGVWIKFENLQFTASFKERGALVKLASLDPEQRSKGVIAASAGNHAQGVAYHAKRLGIPAVIVMPRYTPSVKVERTREFGAEVLLAGEGFDDAKAHALELAPNLGLEFIHAYDDERVVAGQGTIALEMLAQQPDLDTLVVPVGGGGLIAGIAIAAKHLKSRIEVIGVQSSRFPGVYYALKGGKPEFGVSTVADGIAVREPGRIVSTAGQFVDDVLLVDEGDIEQAIVMLLEIEKTVAEGAGAVGLAALVCHRQRFAGRRVGLVLTGGNIDPLALAFIMERGLARSGRLARLTVELRDLPGSLAQVTSRLAELGANIEEVHHQRTFTQLPLQTAEVQFVVQTRNHEHVREIVAALHTAGYNPVLHGPASESVRRR